VTSRRAKRIVTLAAQLARQRAPVLAPMGVIREDDPRAIFDGDAGLRDGDRRALQVGGQRGMSAVLDYGQAQSLLAWAADDPHAKAVTITLDGPRLTQPPDAATDLRVVARLTWGTEGGLAEAEIDWVRGTAFTVWASHLSLAAFHEGVLTPAGGTARAKVTAHCGYQPVGDAVPPQRTRFLGTLGIGATSALVPIPAYAHKVHLQWLAAGAFVAGATAEIEILGAQATPTVLGTIAVSNFAFDQVATALPNDAAFVRLVNVSGAGIVRSRLVFALRV